MFRGELEVFRNVTNLLATQATKDVRHDRRIAQAYFADDADLKLSRSREHPFDVMLHGCAGDAQAFGELGDRARERLDDGRPGALAVDLGRAQVGPYPLGHDEQFAPTQ